MTKGQGMLIGLSGKARAGKDTVGDMLVADYGFKKFSFAEPLKAIAYDLDPMIDSIHSLGFLVDQMGWHEAKKIPEVRRTLQDLGSAARRHLDKGVWVRPAMQAIDAHIKDGGSAVITDLRHVNEAEAVLKRGGAVIRIERPGTENGGHETETNLDDFEFTYTLHNDRTFYELSNGVAAVLADLSAQDGSGASA